MGVDPSSLNDRQRQLIEPADRQELGLQVSKAMHKRKLNTIERDEQRTLAAWLKLREDDGVLVFDWSRTDRRSTCRKGMPDFKLYRFGRVLLGEMKIEDGRLSADQVEMMERFKRAGTQVQLWRSAAEAIEKIRDWLLTL
jgi:hypothetical protein